MRFKSKGLVLLMSINCLNWILKRRSKVTLFKVSFYKDQVKKPEMTWKKPKLTQKNKVPLKQKNLYYFIKNKWLIFSFILSILSLENLRFLNVEPVWINLWMEIRNHGTIKSGNISFFLRMAIRSSGTQVPQIRGSRERGITVYSICT